MAVWWDQGMRLVRGRAAVHTPSVLDPVQAAAVAHRQGEGPLVIVGGPGTGKTTTLVELLAARVERDGVAPDAVLVLAPTRTAAAALRDRLTARLGRTVREPLARTPHAYAYGLLRRARTLAGDPPARLISGPEQDRLLAELLAGHEQGVGRVPSWPSAVGPDVRALRGFRDELRDLLMRAVERGLTPVDLAGLGRRAGRPEWVAAADVLAEYLDVTSLATPGAFDPAGIVVAAADLLEDDPDLAERERRSWQVVAVEDLQEGTAAVDRLVGLLAGGGRDLVLTGDPDLATQAFRGARPRLVAEAARRFPRADGEPARVVVLGTVHRCGPDLRAAVHRVAERIGTSGPVVRRAAMAVGPSPPDGRPAIEVHLLPSAAQEAAFVAQYLRRRHLADGVPWGAMAVVVRSSRGTQALRRSLGAAGVPVAVPAAEVPVRDEPAARPLLLALRCALDPGSMTPAVAVELLTGPLAGLDSVALRRLRRALRAEELSGGGGRGSEALLVEALADPAHLASLDPGAAGGARRLSAVLAAGRAAAADPARTAETVLWALWDRSGLAEPWRRSALAGGAGGARADRDLDAVVALFEAASRFVDRLPHAGPEDFLAYLEGQDLPSDRLAERAPSGESVTLVTATGAAGREWDVVAVPGVQEGTWPDLRLRGSLLGAQALADLVDGRSAGGTEGAAAQRRAVLDDELRLFHVAVSRPRRRLLVTAVSAQDDLPSPFLDLLDPPAAASHGGDRGGAADPVDPSGEVRAVSTVPRALTLPALVAELRSVAADPSASRPDREHAATGLARLARAGVPGAAPQQWYGLAPLSAQGPLRPPDAPVAVSPSRVEAFDRCALRWLLEQAGATDGSSTAQQVGSLLHAIAEQVPDGHPGRLQAALEAAWPRLGLGRGWAATQQRQRLEEMVAKLGDYLRRVAPGAGRELVAVEQDVRVRVGRADVRGTVDRLERDADGRLVVVDLKTGRSAPSADETGRNAQLGVYQLAVEEGGFEDAAPGSRTSGGAVLVHVGTPTRSVSLREQPALSGDDDPAWARNLIEVVADAMAGEAFEAIPNGMCARCPVRRCCPLQPEGMQVGQ